MEVFSSYVENYMGNKVVFRQLKRERDSLHMLHPLFHASLLTILNQHTNYILQSDYNERKHDEEREKLKIQQRKFLQSQNANKISSI